MTKKDAALAAGRQWRIFPASPDDRFPPAWQELASRDPETITGWWDKQPDANPCVLCGPDSGIMVLDVDPRNGGNESFSRLEKELGPLPETLTVSTGGGGAHYYFRYQALGKASFNGSRPGLDLKVGDGGGSFVFGPGTRRTKHDGRPYTLYEKHEAVADLPAAWVAALTASSNGTKPADPSPLQRIPEGRRNDALTRLAGRYRKQGHRPDQIEVLLRLDNTRCEPPLPESEIATILKSAAAWDSPRVTQLVSLAELAKNPPPKPEELGRMAWRGDVTCFAGREKHGKSTFATTDISEAVEAGRSALWVSCEESSNLILHRFQKAECGGMSRVWLPEARPRSWADVEEWLTENRPDYVLIDTLSSFLSAVGEAIPDHSEGERWQAVIQRFKALAEDYECGVVVIHHLAKNSGEVRGSTGITGGVDNIITLTPLGKVDQPGRRLERSRSRWGHSDLELVFDGMRYGVVEHGRFDGSLMLRVYLAIRRSPGIGSNDLKTAVHGSSKAITEAVRDLTEMKAVKDHGTPYAHKYHATGRFDEQLRRIDNDHDHF